MVGEVHKALREALANCLINADYHGLRGVVIRKEPDKIVLANLGYIRTGKKQMRLGGESDPRNKSLMKMFNFINIGERAGSGVPNIFNTWEDEGLIEPEIEERFDPDRTVLSLPFKKKQAIKTQKNIAKIREFLQETGEATTNDIAEYLNLSPARIRVLLKGMDDIEAIGENRGRKYKIHQNNFRQSK